MAPSRGRPRPSPTSATSGRSGISSRRGGASSARPKLSVLSARLMARSSEAMSFGAKRCTAGSGRLARRSEMSWALASMLRRSWLILLTARPSAASRLFCCRVCVSSACMCASSRSAVPISSWRGGRHDDAAGILRVLAEAQHVAGDAHHRLHQQAVEREIDERRGDDRDDDRQAEDVEAVADHGRLQRRLGQHHLDEVAGAHAGLADHADDAALRATNTPSASQIRRRRRPSSFHTPGAARWRGNRRWRRSARRCRAAAPAGARCCA